MPPQRGGLLCCSVLFVCVCVFFFSCMSVGRGGEAVVSSWQARKCSNYVITAAHHDSNRVQLVKMTIQLPGNSNLNFESMFINSSAKMCWGARRKVKCFADQETDEVIWQHVTRNTFKFSCPVLQICFVFVGNFVPDWQRHFQVAWKVFVLEGHDGFRGG